MANLMPSNGLTMVESYGLIFRQSNFEFLIQLEAEYNIIPKMHIYMVVKTPKINFKKDEVLITKQKIQLKVIIIENENIKERKILMKNNSGTNDLIVEFNSNADDIKITDKMGNIILTANAFMLLIDYKYNISCEVVYIGRSFGTDGTSTVYKRLKSHSTLQKIYSEKEDNRHIFLTAWNFDRNSIGYFPPYSNESISKEKFLEHLKMVNDPYDFVRRNQEINFTEAALIRYFQPKYNNKMKYTFPSKTHADYNDCYKSKLDYIAVEMDTKRLNIKLYSQLIQEDYKHDIFFDLNGRKKMSEFFRLA